MRQKSTRNRIRRRVQKTFSLLLAFALLLNVSSMSALAADQESGNIEVNEAVNEEAPASAQIEAGGEANASAQAEDVEIEGDGPIGDMVASALSEEQARAEEDVRIVSVSFNGATAAVTYDTQGTTRDCDLVVAIYAEGPEPRQMLASGTASVPGGGYKRDCICKY